jgi:hypothetical protein
MTKQCINFITIGCDKPLWIKQKSKNKKCFGRKDIFFKLHVFISVLWYTYDFRVQTMFGSFLHPFVLSNVYVLEILFAFIYAYWNAETLVTWCTRQKMKTSIQSNEWSNWPFFYIKFNGIDVTKPKNHLVKVRKKRSTAGTHRKADNMLKKHVWNITNILSIENLSIKRQVSGFL